MTKKTGAVFHHPVSAEAMEACGPAGDGLIFKGLTANMTTYIFKEWVADAGIKKPVSFHTLRHTYATLLHENGNSLHTIQNLMIHLHPGTTAQYICNSDALARKATDSLHLQPSRLKSCSPKSKNYSGKIQDYSNQPGTWLNLRGNMITGTKASRTI